jgi:hypothetical protein
MSILYPPSSRSVIEDADIPVSVFRRLLKLLVASSHLYHEKLNDPVPEGLTAVNEPFTVPEVLQYIKTGSFLAGAEGYDTYFTALAPGAASWPLTTNGTIVIKIQKKYLKGK